MFGQKNLGIAVVVKWYSDRKRAALVDLYESTVTDQYVPYIMPQEHGNHTDVRWLSVTRKSEGLMVQTGPVFVELCAPAARRTSEKGERK